MKIPGIVVALSLAGCAITPVGVSVPVAASKLTLLRDRADLLPLRRVDDAPILLRVHGDGVAATAGQALVEALAHCTAAAGRVGGEQTAAADRRVLRRAAGATRVILAVELGAAVALPNGVVELVRVHPATTVLALGKPAAAALGQFAAASTLVVVDATGAAAERALAAALLGRVPLTGRLSTAIAGVAAVGSGRSRFPVLRPGNARDEGMAADLSARIRRLLSSKVAAGAFPGAVAMVTRRGRIVAEVAVGRHSYATDAVAVSMSTRYDLASLTKVCATLPALAVLMERGVVDLDDHLVQWVPEFQGVGKADITLRQVAVHAAGLQWWDPFYKTLQGKAAVVRAAAVRPLAFAAGSQYKYSDLGLILLMAVIERATELPMEQFLRRQVYPLLQVEAVFSRTGAPIAAAPTETDAWRKRTVCGEVHDENAFAMGGVSGHAGLFGTAADVIRIGNTFLGGGGGLLRPSTVAGLVKPVGLIRGSSRAVLWDTFRSGGSGGSKLSPQSFGHTGFTGTSVWCDPVTDLCMVLLTNRVHPTRKNHKISAVRREFHDLVVDALELR